MLRKILEEELKNISADSYTDLQPQSNRQFEFKIELKDPNQTPINCKPRKLPFNLKSQVKAELDKYEKAGIIRRRSNSEWCSPLKAVHKPDGSVRITVDYRNINKIIKRI